MPTGKNKPIPENPEPTVTVDNQQSVTDTEAVSAEEVVDIIEEQAATKVKKELYVADGPGNLYEIKYRGGGEVPAILQGYWNNHNLATQQIQLYTRNKGK